MIKDKLRLNIINIVFFSIIFLLIIIFGSGYFPIMDECKFYELDGKFYLFRFIPMLIVGIFSYIYSLIKKMEKPSHFYMVFTIVIFAIIGMIQMPLERYRIKLRPSIVTKAVVIDKPANYAGLYAEVVYYVK